MKVTGAFEVIGSVEGVGGVGSFDVLKKGIREEDMCRVKEEFGVGGR